MNTLIHILVADDDQEICQLLSDFLSKHNYQVHTVADGQALLDALEQPTPTYDLIILDIMMPHVDGIEACRRIRTDSAIPIIMLTAMSDDIDRIVGLECGADDYLPKPFNPRELLARIKAVLRRSHTMETTAASTLPQLPTYEFAGWLLRTAERILLNSDQVEVALSSTSYDLLLAFLENPQRVLTRDQLMDIVYNREAGPFDRNIDVQVSRLRQKIEEDPKHPKLIKTIRSGGYLLATSVKHST